MDTGKVLDSAESLFIIHLFFGIKRLQDHPMSQQQRNNQQVLNEATRLQDDTLSSVQRMSQQATQSQEVGSNSLVALKEHDVKTAKIAKHMEQGYNQ